MKYVSRMMVLFVLMLIAPMAEAQLKDNDYVAIIGDSITEQRQYSVFINQYLLVCKPAQNLQATQFGWGGETSWGFNSRMADDCLPFKPTVATTCFGMNDGGYNKVFDDRIKNYENSQRAIVQKLKAAGVRFIVVGSPGVVDADKFQRQGSSAELYNATLGTFRDIARKVAAEEGVAFADVHAAMLDVMIKAKAKYGPTYHLGGNDGVHPDRNGHLVMAYALLKALGVNGEIGTITVDLGKSSATATEGHQVLGVENGGVKLESSKYPFCFFGDPSKTNATAGVIEFLPFNEDLNRFKLVVSGATAPRLKVTWGKTSKEYPAEDLAKGVNLAADFIDNPFCEPFLAVEKKVQYQQNAEVEIVKQLIHALPAFKKRVPDKAALMDEVRAALIQQDEELRKASSDAVAPVTHTITIEAVK
jgi:lysophospholipase L1-like esterase